MPHVNKGSLTDTSSEIKHSAQMPKNLSVTAKYMLHKHVFFSICSIFHALIRYIKCIKDQQMHFSSTDVLLLYYHHQHVLMAT
jgi:hypothetical protein